MRITCRFSIACKGKHIGVLPLVMHRYELTFERFGYHLARRMGRTCAPFGIESTFTIKAVESANLTVGRHKVDAKT